MSDITPFPNNSPDPCPRCHGPVNIYEKDLQDAPEGLVCGNCTRAEIKRKGRDPRKTDKGFRWKHGHDPNDDEATPESGFGYVTLEPTEAVIPNDRKELQNQGGPPSGADCFNCLASGRGAVGTRIVAELSPYDARVGMRPTEGTEATKEKAVITACPKCGSFAHWNPKELERMRIKNGRQ